MMTDKAKKIDPKLLAELERLEHSGEVDRRLAVVIEHVSEGTSPSGTAGSSRERKGSPRQRLLDRLKEARADQVRELSLADAVVAHLTPPQIRALATDDDVKRILWDVPERVTL